VSHLCHYEEPSWVSSEDLLKHAKPVSSSSSAAAAAAAVKTPGGESIASDTHANVELPPVVQNKIESLKDRIKQLEASIAVTELSRSTPPVFNNNYGQNQGLILPQPQQSFQSFPQVQSVQDNQMGHQAPPPPPTHQQQYQSPHTQYPIQQPIFNSQPPPPQFQPPTNNVFSVPPISETAKYEADLYDKVDFFDYLPFIIKKRRLESHGPTSYLSLMRKDIYLKVLWTYIWKLLERARAKIIDPSKPKDGCLFDSNIDPLSTESFSDGKYSLTYKELKKEKMAQKIQSLNTMSSKSIDQIILEVLPPKKIIMILSFRFFKFVYPFLPFLDENTFFYEIDGILGSINFNDSKIEQMNIHNKYDYSIIGLLLLVLKLGYLSISEKELQEKEELKPLKDFKFNPNVINAVHLCLEQYKFWRKPFSLRLMQLMLYIKCYYRYCNEDDDVSDGSDNQIMLGTLFSSAYALGLHRDPDLLSSLGNSVKKKTHAQLWRRMWHKMLELDASQAVNLGLPLHVIDDRSYDTALPYDHTHEDETDKHINADYHLVAEKNQIFRQISDKIGNIRNAPSVLDLMHMSRKLENFSHYRIGSLKDILSDQKIPNFIRIKKVGYLFEVTSALLNLNNRLFIHFESKKNIKRTFKYMENCLKISLKIINTAMNLAFNEDLYVGKGFAFYFRPNAATAVFRAFFLLSSVGLRLQQAKAMIKNSDMGRHNLFDSFAQVVFHNMENTLQLLAKMSANYYNFSRIVTAFRLTYHEMKDPNFDFDKAGYDLIHDVTADESMIHNHLQEMKPEDLPKSNIMLDFIDSEINRLMEISKSNLVAVLQPAVHKGKTDTSSTHNDSHIPQPYNPSGTGRGQFYDPVDGFTKKSSPSTESSSFNLSPSAINQNNIFNIEMDDLNKILVPHSAEDTQNLRNVYYDSNVLSSEEYASLFGVFDDYGVDASSLRNL